jgi:Fe-coproporphyrin III synthase
MPPRPARRSSLGPPLRAGWQLVRANLARLPRPVRVNLAVTHRCQSRCQTCFVWKADPEPELSLDDYRRLFEANRHLCVLTVTGGEPFLREDLVDILAAAAERCPGLYYVHITTNGLATERVVQGVGELLSAGLNRLVVVVSLDGPREIHDRIRGGEGFFDRSVETYRGLRAFVGSGAPFELYAGMTVSHLNLGALDALYQAMRQRIPGFEARELNANLAHRSAHYYRNTQMDLSFQPEAAEEVFAFFEEHLSERDLSRNWLERCYHRYALEFARTGRCPIRCRAADISVHLDPTGLVYPCHVDSNPIGWLQDHGFSLGALATSPAYREAQRRVRAGECSQCWTPCGAYDSLLGQLWRFRVGRRRSGEDSMDPHP